MLLSRPVIFSAVLFATTALPPCHAQSAGSELAKARAFESAGQIGKAMDAYRAVSKRHAKSPEAPAALFALARLQEASNDYLAAYRSLEQLVDKYPKSADFNQALEAMFRIASKFLEGEKLKLLGVPAVPSMSKAAEMFDKIVSLGPFSRIAPAAQFNAGLAYEKARRFPEAAAAYERVSDNYPGSEFAADALYQAAYVQMLQTKGAGYDQTFTKKALNAFQEFVITYPNHPKTPQALSHIAQLEGRKIQGNLSVAEFYATHGNIPAAIVSYQQVIDRQPGSSEAREAAKRIEALRKQQAEQMAKAEKGGFRVQNLVPKLPKIKVPFPGKKKEAEPAAAEPAPEPPKKAAKAASKPSKPVAQPAVVEPDMAVPLQFSDPGPQIRSEFESAVEPVPAPAAPKTPQVPRGPEVPRQTP